jgi:3-oxosteroid 1-dehydrogenase
MSPSRSPYRDPWWERVLDDGLPPRPQGSEPSGQDTFDVVVVGAGMAGYVAAIFTHELGGSVLMLDAASEAGGTAYKSGAGMWVPDNSLRRARGIAANRDWAMAHMARLAYPEQFDPSAVRLGLGEREYELIAVYNDTASDVLDELHALGLGLMEFPSFTGAYEAMVEYHSDIENGFGTHLAPQQPNGGYGAGVHLIQQLSAIADDREIELRTDHRVTGVLTNDAGEVVGVTASTPQRDVTLNARKGVVFATGGYPHNRDLTLEHFPGGLYGSCAVPTARGDFIEIARGLGAEPANMGEGWGTEHPLEQMLVDPQVDEHVGVFPGDSVLMVNAAGHRVVNEKLIYHERSKVHFERDADGGLPNHLTFLIFDDFIVDDETSQPNKWPSPDPAQPWVISGQSVAELAAAIDARLEGYGERIGNVRLADDFAAELEATVDRFNGFARAGRDDDFHRGETDVELDWTGPSHVANDQNPTMWPLDDGPYHCIILAGSVLDTNGGPPTSPAGEVLRRDGTPIPGLYGAGNCVASPAGAGYWSGGSTLGPAAVFAHHAARHIAGQDQRAPSSSTEATV